MEAGGSPTGRGAIETVLLPTRRAARCVRPTAGATPNDKVELCGTLIGVGVVICGARTKGATFDSTPRRVSLGKRRIESDRMRHLHRVQPRLQVRRQRHDDPTRADFVVGRNDFLFAIEEDASGRRRAVAVRR